MNAALFPTAGAKPADCREGPPGRRKDIPGIDLAHAAVVPEAASWLVALPPAGKSALRPSVAASRLSGPGGSSDRKSRSHGVPGHGDMKKRI